MNDEVPIVPHSGPVCERIAAEHTVLLGQVGSGVHGVTTGDDDRDEMGVCIEPPEYVIGLGGFEQFQFRSAPTGVKSGPGDLDKTVYGLRKWARLAANGNPTLLLLLFIPDHELVVCDDIGRDIQARSELFVSRLAAKRFVGYLVSQQGKMLGRRGRSGRPDLVGRFGFDTKAAYHMVRLGLQGRELLTTGRITLPIPEPDRSWLVELRHGMHSKVEALGRADELLADLELLTYTAELPRVPDSAALDKWLISSYRRHWQRNGLWPTQQSN